MPHRHQKPGARIFVRSTSFGCSRDRVIAATGITDPGYNRKKLLRKKKNESWAMRPRPYKSDSRSWRKLVCRIVQFGSFRSAHASRVLVSASRRNNLFLTRESLPLASQKKSSRSRGGHAITRDARAT